VPKNLNPTRAINKIKELLVKRRYDECVDRNRLKWKCRRGLLELDLVLERYMKANPQDERLSELLEPA